MTEFAPEPHANQVVDQDHEIYISFDVITASAESVLDGKGDWSQLASLIARLDEAHRSRLAPRFQEMRTHVKPAALLKIAMLLAVPLADAAMALAPYANQPQQLPQSDV
jgi:hypothetical protein